MNLNRSNLYKNKKLIHEKKERLPVMSGNHSYIADRRVFEEEVSNFFDWLNNEDETEMTQSSHIQVRNDAPNKAIYKRTISDFIWEMINFDEQDLAPANSRREPVKESQISA